MFVCIYYYMYFLLLLILCLDALIKNVSFYLCIFGEDDGMMTDGGRWWRRRRRRRRLKKIAECYIKHSTGVLCLRKQR